ncbi:hypothetical protein NQ317_009015 [Molorchus minor]|uniref:Flavoprotein pyridine nucleotide cytochrome reductase-like FAD-binding domain-containing protein n=1 Tax=Molorchus minor TaxID=1323400 RepID=A0ABQ9JKZ0_9CUCU|nr:hypothetical protein NQ317_009015 [Molorchus minor]
MRKKYLEELCLQYEPGQHFLLKADFKGEQFTRAYTPIPIEDGDTLQFTTLIKLYKQGKIDCNNIYLRDQLYNLSSNWNFTYEIFLSKNENVCEKYNEVIHNRLSCTDIQSYLVDKYENVYVLICGSDSFSECMTKYLKDCKPSHKLKILVTELTERQIKVFNTQN